MYYGPRQRGTVKSWRKDRGFGQIIPEGSENQTLPVSREQLRYGVFDLCKGDEVSFLKDWDLRNGSAKEVAVDVQVMMQKGQNVHEIIRQAAANSYQYPAAFMPQQPPPGVQCTGVVKRWLNEKGFGFLRPDMDMGGEDIYVHRSALDEGITELQSGDKVMFLRFDDGKGRGKFRATNVTKLGSGSLFRDLPLQPSVPLGAQKGLSQWLEMAGEEETPELLSFLEPFVLRSSLNCPFLVLSETQLVTGMAAPTAEEFKRLKRLVTCFVAACQEKNAVLLADFEGEMPGHGGEISIAQLQFSEVLDPASLIPRRLAPEHSFQAPGLLIDLRCPNCVDVIREVMGSPRILKVLWGANGDCQCLMYQRRPVHIGVDPQMLIDAQVAFDDRVRIGMAKMLESVPAEIQKGLPTKQAQIDWDAFHFENRRALELPLSPQKALYAVDDLHRIEAILGTKQPISGAYASAFQRSAQMLQDLRDDPYGLRTLQQDLVWLEKLEGRKKMVKAVIIARHCNSLTLRGATLTDEQNSLVRRARVCANDVLKTQHLQVPTDLSFKDDAVASPPTSYGSWSTPSSSSSMGAHVEIYQ